MQTSTLPTVPGYASNGARLLQAACAASIERGGATVSEIPDLISNLPHLAVREGLDAAEHRRRGLSHFDAERGRSEGEDDQGTGGREYDHDAYTSDDNGGTNRCRYCGEKIVWTGPYERDWLHVDDVRNH